MKNKPEVTILLDENGTLPNNKDYGIPISEYQNLHYGIYEIKNDTTFMALRQVFDNKEDAQFFLDKLKEKFKSLKDKMKEYHNECLSCVEAFRYGVPCPIDGECPYKRGR